MVCCDYRVDALVAAFFVKYLAPQFDAFRVHRLSAGVPSAVCVVLTAFQNAHIRRQCWAEATLHRQPHLVGKKRVGGGAKLQEPSSNALPGHACAVLDVRCISE